MENKNFSFSIAADSSYEGTLLEKIGLTIAGFGTLLLFVSFSGITNANPAPYLSASLLSILFGTILYAREKYIHRPEGIKNNGVFQAGLSSRGAMGWLAGIVITGFYVLLYWYPQYLGLGPDGAANTGMVRLFDPLSMLLKGSPASQWFVYGTLYTICILALGLKFMWKYRHNKYQLIRTISVMFFQTAFAFLIPEFMQAMQLPYFDFKNMWPLNYYMFDDYSMQGFLSNGNIGLFMLLSGLAMVFIVSPVLTYFYGKRWYCSWVCGCGGLAETAGDSFRQLSDKSSKAWRFERYLIHIVLVLVVLMTFAVIFSYLHNSSGELLITKTIFVWIITVIFIGLALLTLFSKKIKESSSKANRIAAASIMVGILLLVWFSYLSGSGNAFFIDATTLRWWYGFLIGSTFSGVIGVGFYPILGSRVWCRFGCPMAAILGLQQRFFSRFRITTNGDQCISCGNCSTYCEMGIDVRWYAQRGQDIVRASCVGCGVCSAVCPRGVLKLENGPTDSRKIINIDEYGINIKP